MAHGLDRPITVRVTVGARNDYGEYEEVNHDSRRWATRIDQSNARILEAYGSRSDASRIYRVRWYDRLAGANATAVKVIDGGVTFNASNVVEVEGRTVERRRKFINVECTAASP